MDPEDPTVIAENELLGAAAAIEAAAKKLEQLRPRTKPKVGGRGADGLRPVGSSAAERLLFFSALQEADESLNFEEQILEAAKSIAAATSALVKAASAAQRELVAQGKVGVNGWSFSPSTSSSWRQQLTPRPPGPPGITGSETWTKERKKASLKSGSVSQMGPVWASESRRIVQEPAGMFWT